MLEGQPASFRITVEYQASNPDVNRGRWAKVYHIFDLDNREIALHQKEAIQLAKAIIAIAKKK